MAYNKKLKNIIYIIFITLISFSIINGCKEENPAGLNPSPTPKNSASIMPYPDVSVPPPIIPLPNAPFGD